MWQTAVAPIGVRHNAPSDNGGLLSKSPSALMKICIGTTTEKHGDDAPPKCGTLYGKIAPSGARLFEIAKQRPRAHQRPRGKRPRSAQGRELIAQALQRWNAHHLATA